jgi:hypothetical protein
MMASQGGKTLQVIDLGGWGVPEFEVAYSSNPTAPGGYYRSLLGRALLKTRDMVQTISAPDGVHNEVAFAAFGFIDGRVSLQGIPLSWTGLICQSTYWLFQAVY